MCNPISGFSHHRLAAFFLSSFSTKISRLFRIASACLWNQFHFAELLLAIRCYLHPSHAVSSPLLSPLSPPTTHFLFTINTAAVKKTTTNAAGTLN